MRECFLGGDHNATRGCGFRSPRALGDVAVQREAAADLDEAASVASSDSGAGGHVGGSETPEAEAPAHVQQRPEQGSAPQVVVQ